MQQVQNQTQLQPGQAAAAAPLPGGGGGGGDDNGDHNRRAPGRAHYADAETVASWRLIYNKDAGSAGEKDKHRRCLRCGRRVGEHHRINWRAQKCICCLCNNTVQHGHFGAICPRMEENREIFSRMWVRDAFSGHGK